MTTTPHLARTREELGSLLSPMRMPDQRADRQADGQAGRQVGLVPTMGALHDGHASLMRAAREHVSGGPVVVSIFVNPMQFGPGEDLDEYPRSLDADLKLCEREGVDIVFAPDLDQIYPGGEPLVAIDPGPLGEVLEGDIRPGHFRGVLTVVAKLFGMVRPDVAVFGEKDYQQLVLIRRMVTDLCLGIEIVGVETRREPDGLALSSRNRYLDTEHRLRAVALSRILQAAKEAGDEGPAAALAAAEAELLATDDIHLDYVAITDRELGELPAEPPPGTEGRVLIAARVGGTRLIDNVPITIGGG